MDYKPADVAVFWDMGSCPAPGGASAASGLEIVDRIRTLALRFGVIKSFKGYMPSNDFKPTPSPFGALKLRSQLQSSGVSLIDVPGRQDYSDKMVIVDMLTYAFDRSPNVTVLVLITAEPSFSYTLALLRMRNYRVVVLAPESEERLSLMSQAASCFNWTYQAYPAGSETPMGFGTHEGSEQPSPGSRSAESAKHRSNHTLPPGHSQQTRAENCTQASDEEQKAGLEGCRPPRQRPGFIHKVASTSYSTATRSEEDTLHSNPEAFLTITRPSESTFRGVPEQQDDFKGKAHIRNASIWEGDLDDVGLAASPSLIPALSEIAPNSPPADRKVVPDESIPNLYSSQPSSCTSQRAKPVIHSPPWYGLDVSPGLPSGPLDEGGQYSSVAHGAGAPLHPKPSTANDIPPSFSTLTDVLGHFKDNGSPRPLRSTVALEITRRDRLAYKSAGCTTFAQFTSKAEALGLIELGGWMGTAWIALKDRDI